MRAHTAILEINRQYKIHTEFYYNPAASQTILLVNGSLSTTAAFAQTLKYLLGQFNVVLYDQPYAGGSKAHNNHSQPLKSEEEAAILLSLIEHFQASLLMSFSWGGLPCLLALAQRPPLIEKAVIASFTPRINAAMRDYLQQGLQLFANNERDKIASLVNDNLGQHLPTLFKRYNHRHISSLDEHEYAQMLFNIQRVLQADNLCYTRPCRNIEIPLLFINGQRDIHTSPADALGFADLVQNSQFRTLADAGHFLDMEHRQAWKQMRHELLSFLSPASGTGYRCGTIQRIAALAG
ncbi:Pimeloyl-ACP methyl ester carboxylesterase [Pseudomonas pohangensis]|uniref:Pimeloyl-ACP methyl ester carboxylesterase n=1 Tax=Pseudomonas pohangensis TaxID=364197 RepID=A0A1H2ENC2_9PSED|nr:alpha/beta hydrolase [Pseudomonas pohangensis]SDT96544.1 Pimeloyl-ACP methyl ester carboxylesterase [Pseudomonas pohangensis]